MLKVRSAQLVKSKLLFVITLVSAHSFASAAFASTAAAGPDFSWPAANVAALPDAPTPQSTQQTPPPPQTTPSSQNAAQQVGNAVQQAGSAVQQAGSNAMNSVSNTANMVANRSLTFGERVLDEVDAGYLGYRGKWDVTVFRGEHAKPYTKLDKIDYAGHEEWSPLTIFEASYSAGYEQLRDATPHYGHDKGAYGERLGAAAFRQGAYRLFGDGIFPALLHEDPRYYRVARGSLWYRSSHSVLQVVVNHRDDGSVGPNYSTVAGELVSNSLPLTFYPSGDVHTSTVVRGVAFSLLDDAALKLFREFLPDTLRFAKLVPQAL